MKKYEEMPLFSPPIRVPKIDQLDDVDFMTKPLDTDIPLTDFQYDDLNQFDYTKEDLELEVCPFPLFSPSSLLLKVLILLLGDATRTEQIIIGVPKIYF